MKKLLLFLIISTVLVSCEKWADSDDPIEEVTTPTSFRVDIPDVLSSAQTKYASAAEVSGENIFNYMKIFINVAEESAKITEDIILSLKEHNIDKAMSFSFTSNLDERTKYVEVIESKSFEDAEYELFLTMTDEEGDTAMQIVWNRNPVEGTAIISPYQFDRFNNSNIEALKCRIDYSENVEKGYEACMEVSASGWHMPLSEKYGLDNLKLFAGRNGDIVEVYGCSNHPNATFIDETKVGYSWNFAGRCNETSNIAVAKVALPFNTVETSEGLFEEYSLEKVFRREFEYYAYQLHPEFKDQPVDMEPFLEPFLEDAQSPAYFTEQGWTSCGDSIPDNEGFTEEFINMSEMGVFAPASVKDLLIGSIE